MPAVFLDGLAGLPLTLTLNNTPRDAIPEEGHLGCGSGAGKPCDSVGVMEACFQPAVWKVTLYVTNLRRRKTDRLLTMLLPPPTPR